jgi:streptomycin 6-kinase
VDRVSVHLPAELLGQSRRQESWAPWLTGLPRLIGDVCQEWQLTPDGAVLSGQTAAVLPVRTEAGERAAVKFGWPHPEAEYEHLALRAWAGKGAVRLLRADPRRSVLLLERAEPGRDLETVQILQACEVIAGLYAQLHRPALPQLDLLSTHAAGWADQLPALRDTRLVPRRFVDQAASLAAEFAVDPATDGTLVHTDLHYANVLAATRAGAPTWLAIDPKPLSGDPAYEVAPVLWNRWDEAVGSGNVRNALLDRLYALVDAAGLDEDRVRAWVTVREIVNIWDMVQDPVEEHDGSWVTMSTTIVKAVQR